ncbi:hypothetical protein L2703_03275 [Shewanella basaltis]|uniref:hypothetical protein n=1 Tax=Shewanella basaltis TaxID=472183 RepID=UPI00200D6B20|nr:hypothetical protein [Shewanella basaltis]MCL1112633.1 hypothetical protein [Shewanella basaltis]
MDAAASLQVRFCDTPQVHPCKLGHDVHVMDGHSRAGTRGSMSSLLAVYWLDV